MLDKKFRLPRIWSNRELKKISHLFQGTIVNISGWKDFDKEGNKYSDYFVNADSYYISNYKTELKGFQGYENEFFLDLTIDLNENLLDKFDVVFNHTTLEHIFEVKKAFKNLCLLSRDIVIIIVPFLQQMHGKYDDCWRFTPITIKRLFEENNFQLLYLNFNHHKKASIYIFAIASKNPEKWKDKINYQFNYKCKRDFLDEFEGYIGCKAISNSIIFRITRKLRYLGGKFINKIIG